MPYRPVTHILATALAMGVAAPALGQQIPPLEDGPKIVNVEVFEHDLKMTDAQTGKVIIDSRGMPFHDDAKTGTSLEPMVDVQVQPSGFDLIYTYHNDTGKTMGLGRLRIGIITLGKYITWHDMIRSQQAVQDNYDTYTPKDRVYPRQLYSPLTFLYNDEYAVGASLQYPMLEYKHDARVTLASPANQMFAEGEGGRGWSVEFRLSNLGMEKPGNNIPLDHSGSIAPGETRTYVVSLRVTKTPSEWQRTLLPYRNYFQNKYGGVQYQRDPRPIHAWALAYPEAISPTNPFGWGMSKSHAPDMFGFKPHVDDIKKVKGWDRTMIRAGSGLYYLHPAWNYPFHVASRWKNSPMLMTAFDPEDGLPSLAAAGQSLGLWWGRAAQHADSWDPASMSDLDVNDPAIRQEAMNEVDCAYEAGVRELGLDTFTGEHMPAWDLLKWLQTMQHAYPDMRFEAEPLSFDILHLYAAAVYRGYNADAKSADEVCQVNNPLYLADFLIPGHETIVHWRYEDLEKFGVEPSEERIVQDIKKFGEMGYIAQVPEKFDLIEKVTADKSWLFTVPADLVQTVPPPAGGDADSDGFDMSGDGDDDNAGNGDQGDNKENDALGDVGVGDVGVVTFTGGGNHDAKPKGPIMLRGRAGHAGTIADEPGDLPDGPMMLSGRDGAKILSTPMDDPDRISVPNLGASYRHSTPTIPRYRVHSRSFRFWRAPVVSVAEAKDDETSTKKK